MSHVPPQEHAEPIMLEFRPAMRRLIEDAIESFILLLDEIDDDPDLEDGHDRESNPAEWGIADTGGLLELLGSNEGGGEFEGSGCSDNGPVRQL